MAKDINDKKTRDLISQKGRGGAGRGQGRKPTGLPPKRPLPAKVSQEARDKIKSLARQTELSQAAILEWIILNLDPSELKALKAGAKRP